MSFRKMISPFNRFFQQEVAEDDVLPNRRKPSAITIDQPPRADAQQGPIMEPGEKFPEKTAKDKLTEFRLLTGIQTTREFSRISGVKRPEPNIGIYKRVVEMEKHTEREYKIFKYLVNFTLIVQIIIAAALTAMGAASTSHKAITAFGAINTVLAGALTFLKGSGLPNRLKYYHEEWKKVRESIEQRERKFFLENGDKLVIAEEVKAVEEEYERVKQDIAANTPDAYVSVKSMGKKAEGLDPHAPHPSIDILKDFGEKLKSLEAGIHGRADQVSKSAEGVSSTAHGHFDRLRNLEAGLHARADDASKSVEGSSGAAQENINKLASGIGNIVKNYVADASKHGEEAVKKVEQASEDIEKSAHKGVDVHLSVPHQ